MTTLQHRFESKFTPEPMSGCWLWIGAVNDKKGYGKISIHSKRAYAHRVSWGLYRGPIPAGAHVLHKCDVPCCVNPDHLYLGDQRQNNLDRDRRGRHVALRGSDNGHSRLTAEQVIEIRSRPESSLQIEGDYPVDASTIRQIRRRQTWKHIK